ncbi:hypothetical protein ABB02_01120 [Clostridiaceae bacterium JG1575]|nr:hypothetical protein ABB02_01120 [Clostridiaceae bacterium JG1575]
MTTGSSYSQSEDPVDLEKAVPHNSSVMAETFRVDTPLTTISIMASTELIALISREVLGAEVTVPQAWDGHFRVPTRVFKVRPR